MCDVALDIHFSIGSGQEILVFGHVNLLFAIEAFTAGLNWTFGWEANHFKPLFGFLTLVIQLSAKVWRTSVHRDAVLLDIIFDLVGNSRTISTISSNCTVNLTLA